jgi:hypothetical protein
MILLYCRSADKLLQICDAIAVHYRQANSVNGELNKISFEKGR